MTTRKKRMKKFRFSFDIKEIKKKNLDFGIEYKEVGLSLSYFDILNWSEIDLSNYLFIEVIRVIVFFEEKPRTELLDNEAKNLVKLLSNYNQQTLK